MYTELKVKVTYPTFHARLKLKNIDREKKRVLRKLKGPEIEIRWLMMQMLDADVHEPKYRYFARTLFPCIKK
jgi:hypothetical protein